MFCIQPVFFVLTKQPASKEGKMQSELLMSHIPQVSSYHFFILHLCFGNKVKFIYSAHLQTVHVDTKRKEDNKSEIKPQ